MQKCKINFTYEKGFSLFEILIAITLLAIISIAISQATIRSFQLNQSLSTESDALTSVALALDSLERDISQMYSIPYDTTSIPETNRPSLFWSDALRTDGLRRSRFLGYENKISFITNSNRRVMKNSAESDFQKITWEITKTGTGYALTRKQDLDVFNYQDHSINGEEPKAFTILENIKEAKFQFYHSLKDEWEKEWDSEGSYAQPATRFPEMIALDLEVTDPKNPTATMKWQRQFRTNIELNINSTLTSSTNTGSGGGTGTGTGNGTGVGGNNPSTGGGGP